MRGVSTRTHTFYNVLLKDNISSKDETTTRLLTYCHKVERTSPFLAYRHGQTCFRLIGCEHYAFTEPQKLYPQRCPPTSAKELAGNFPTHFLNRL